MAFYVQRYFGPYTLDSNSSTTLLPRKPQEFNYQPQWQHIGFRLGSGKFRFAGLGTRCRRWGLGLEVQGQALGFGGLGFRVLGLVFGGPGTQFKALEVFALGV